MEFKIEMQQKINDDIRLMADVYLEEDKTNICLYFPEVVEGIDDNDMQKIITFLNDVVEIKKRVNNILSGYFIYDEDRKV